MALENLLVRTKRSIKSDNVEVVLDAVIVERFDDEYQATTNPVELGAEITDHVIKLPKRYSMDAVVSNTPLGGAAFEQLGDTIVDGVTGFVGDSTGTGLTRAQQAYRSLVLIGDTLEPIDVQTGLDLKRNLIIERISSARNKDTSGALFFTMDLRQVIIVETEVLERAADTLRGPERMGAATPVNQGRQLQQELPQDNRSILAKGLDLLF